MMKITPQMLARIKWLENKAGPLSPSEDLELDRLHDQGEQARTLGEESY